VNKTVVKPLLTAAAGSKTILKPRLQYVYVGFSQRKILP